MIRALSSAPLSSSSAAGGDFSTSHMEISASRVSVVKQSVRGVRPCLQAASSVLSLSLFVNSSLKEQDNKTERILIRLLNSHLSFAVHRFFSFFPPLRSLHTLSSSPAACVNLPFFLSSALMRDGPNLIAAWGGRRVWAVSGLGLLG